MKRTILFVVTAFIAFGTVFRAEAKKPEDQEFRRVIVTLKSGEKVEGYLKSGWHADGALLKKENYSFKITKTPDDKESVWTKSGRTLRPTGGRSGQRNGWAISTAGY